MSDTEESEMGLIRVRSAAGSPRPYEGPVLLPECGDPFDENDMK